MAPAIEFCTLNSMQDAHTVSAVPISRKINTLFDLTPAAIISRFNLKTPIYTPTASYGHMGRNTKKSIYTLSNSNNKIEKEIELFPWEKLDYIEKIKAEFNI